MRRAWRIAVVPVDHYENFPVASLLCPAALRPAVEAIYGFARTADDIADEGDAAAEARLADLADYRRDLVAAAAGTPTSPRWRPVFEPLAAAIERHRLPVGLLDDLLDAFTQDVTTVRYADRALLLDYCRRSANPVGRLLLHLYRIADANALLRADAICTALQLANFWQDVTVDLLKDRIYLPLHLFERHGYSVKELFAHRFTPAFRAVMKDAVDRAQELFDEGLPLVRTLNRRLSLDIDLFNRGGLRVLQKIRAQNYDVLAARPAISKAERVTLLLGSLWRVAFMRAA